MIWIDWMEVEVDDSSSSYVEESRGSCWVD